METIDYNDRLQPYSRVVTNPSTLMSLSYVFNKPVTNGNNGNVWNINDGVDSSRNQTFDYDKLNRITSFSSSFGGSRAYSIDLFGNRSCSSGCLSLSFDSFTNRITTTGYGYDAAGNMTTEPSRSYQYDGENRIKTVNSGSTATYSYDGEGRRVKKVTSTETRYYFYDPNGRPVWEYVPGTGWETFNLYFNGQHLATNDASDGLLFLHRDHLGTPRLKTNSSGAFHSDDHYYPYGQQIDTPTGSIPYRFTGKERDTESSLDYFGARYYSNTIGRFTRPDEPLIDQHVDDPQSWNLYSYVRNNPLRFVDPTGRACVPDGKGGFKDDDRGGQSCAEVEAEDRKLKPSATVVGELSPVSLSPFAVQVFSRVEQLAGPPVRFFAGATLAFLNFAPGVLGGAAGGITKLGISSGSSSVAISAAGSPASLQGRLQPWAIDRHLRVAAPRP